MHQGCLDGVEHATQDDAESDYGEDFRAEDIDEMELIMVKEVARPGTILAKKQTTLCKLLLSYNSISLTVFSVLLSPTGYQQNGQC